jgi:hypothetical protein
VTLNVEDYFHRKKRWVAVPAREKQQAHKCPAITSSKRFWTLDYVARRAEGVKI